MKPFLRQQLERYPVRLQELDFFLQQPEVANDMERFRALTREHAEVSEVAGLFERFRQREGDLAQAREMLEDELQKLLLPKDPDDVRNTFLEIRAGISASMAAISSRAMSAMSASSSISRAWTRSPSRWRKRWNRPATSLTSACSRVSARKRSMSLATSGCCRKKSSSCRRTG